MRLSLTALGRKLPGEYYQGTVPAFPALLATKKAGNLNLIEPLLLLLGHGLPPLGALLGELAEFDLAKRERYRLGGNLSYRVRSSREV